MLRLSGAKAIATALRDSKITDLDISDNQLTWNDNGSNLGYMEGVIALADIIPTMGVLTNLNISSNHLGLLVYPTGWRFDPRSKERPNDFYKYLHSDGRGQDEDPGESLVQGSPDGIIALADAISTNGALVKFYISNNSLGSKGLLVLAPALHKSNVTELNIASNQITNPIDGSGRTDDMTGLKAFTDGLVANGALVKLLMGANGFKGFEAGKALGDAIAVNTVLKELDISGGEDGYQKCNTEFVKGFSPGFGTNGALTSLNVSKNALCGIDEFGDGTFDASGLTALADAIGQHQ